jgi:hypothetical protein
VAKRVKTVVRDPMTGVLDRDDVSRTFLDFEAIGHQLGGVLQIVPLREPVNEPGRAADEYETTGWMFVWDSTAPARPRPPVDDVPVEDEPVVTA